MKTLNNKCCRNLEEDISQPEAVQKEVGLSLDPGGWIREGETD